MTDGVFTTATITPIITQISANVGVILPIGLTLFGIMVGISLIPKIFYKFF